MDTDSAYGISVNISKIKKKKKPQKKQSCENFVKVKMYFRLCI